MISFLSTIGPSKDMNITTYTTTETDTPFQFVHFEIGDDHHIVEINDAMAQNKRLDFSNLRKSLYNYAKFEPYEFCADDEHWDEDTSYLTIEIRKLKRKRHLVITSSFKGETVVTKLPITASSATKKNLISVLSCIMAEIYGGFYSWVDKCLDSMWDEDSSDDTSINGLDCDVRGVPGSRINLSLNDY